MMHCCRNYFNSTHEIVKILSKQYPNGQMQMECAHTPIQSPSFLIIWNRQLNWSTKHRPTISFPRSHWLLMKWCSQHAKCPPILLTDSEYLLYLSSSNSFFFIQHSYIHTLFKTLNIFGLDDGEVHGSALICTNIERCVDENESEIRLKLTQNQFIQTRSVEQTKCVSPRWRRFPYFSVSFRYSLFDWVHTLIITSYIFFWCVSTSSRFRWFYFVFWCHKLHSMHLFIRLTGQIFGQFDQWQIDSYQPK